MLIHKILEGSLILESVLPNVEKAIDVLKSGYETYEFYKNNGSSNHTRFKSVYNNVEKRGGGYRGAKKLALDIAELDPYRDKRMTPVISFWIYKGHIESIEEHIHDVLEYKRLKKTLKKLRAPAQERERTEELKRLLKFDLTKRDISTGYPSIYRLQDWILKAQSFVDPERALSDEGLERVGEHRDGNDIFIAYRITKKEETRIPIVFNMMSWCVVRGYFGGYGGPPYYPIIKITSNGDKKPFAMVIPNYFETDPSEAVRNGTNSGILSPRDRDRIRPLLNSILTPEIKSWKRLVSSYEEWIESVERWENDV